MNTKLCVRDAEFTERAEQLRRDAERLRRVRARVRKLIAADEALRRALDGSAILNEDQEINIHTTPEQGHPLQIFIVLLSFWLSQYYDNNPISSVTSIGL
jgi:hypothetical protein